MGYAREVQQSCQQLRNTLAQMINFDGTHADRYGQSTCPDNGLTSSQEDRARGSIHACHRMPHGYQSGRLCHSKRLPPMLTFFLSLYILTAQTQATEGRGRGGGGGALRVHVCVKGPASNHLA